MITYDQQCEILAVARVSMPFALELLRARGIELAPVPIDVPSMEILLNEYRHAYQPATPDVPPVAQRPPRPPAMRVRVDVSGTENVCGRCTFTRVDRVRGEINLDVRQYLTEDNRLDVGRFENAARDCAYDDVEVVESEDEEYEDYDTTDSDGTSFDDLGDKIQEAIDIAEGLIAEVFPYVCGECGGRFVTQADAWDCCDTWPDDDDDDDEPVNEPDEQVAFTMPELPPPTEIDLTELAAAFEAAIPPPGVPTTMGGAHTCPTCGRNYDTLEDATICCPVVPQQPVTERNS